jgi:ferredoxin-nitrite reductase
MNKIEEYKREKDGLDVFQDLPRYSREGWEAITDGDKERLKWLGVFFRRQTPGHFMMRLRISNGMSNSAQFRTIAEIGQRFGKGFVDITTRQQIQLRWFSINHVPEIWDRLETVGLVSLQTGMDNIRNVVGCPVAGLTPNELLDASPMVQQYTDMFLGNKSYTNLPRKFNVNITGCLENCTHVATQDISLTPAVKKLFGEDVKGFNVAVGGKQGSGGYRPASALDVFVPPEEAAGLCSCITLIFRDFGFREARNKARLAFLIDHWGVERFRQVLEERVGHPLLSSGEAVTHGSTTDHVGIFPQKQPGLNYVGLVVPVGRINSEQLFEVARLADAYGNGDIRLTVGQNLIIPNIPDEKLPALKVEPLLEELRYNPSGVMRGLVSCTGMDYCHFALIETKALAVKIGRRLERGLNETGPISIHWSGCPNACGNHTIADIGLLGKRARIDGKVSDAVDIFLGGRLAALAEALDQPLENVPCDKLPQVLEKLIPSPVVATP